MAPSTIPLSGRVLSLVVGSELGVPLSYAPQVRLRARQGIEGDRYFNPFPNGDASRDLTLIEIENLDILARNTVSHSTPERRGATS